MLEGQDGAYRFRYTGLKLPFHAKGSYFLRPPASDGPLVNIIISDSPDLRFEFSRR